MCYHKVCKHMGEMGRHAFQFNVKRVLELSGCIIPMVWNLVTCLWSLAFIAYTVCTLSVTYEYSALAVCVLYLYMCFLIIFIVHHVQ